jgi:ATP-binding cassette, subfamily B, multidrug efflux pump
MNHGYGYFEEDHLGQISDVRLWRRIVAFIAPFRRKVALAVLLSLIISAASLVVPYLLRLAIDQHIVNVQAGLEQRLAGISRIALLFLGVSLIGFVANFFQVTVLELTGQRIMHAMRQRLFTHVLRLQLAFFNANPVGKLVTRLTNDIQNMHEMFTSVIVTLFNEFVKLLGIMVILFWMDWRLALWLTLILPVMVVISVWFSQRARDAFREIRTSLAGINAFLQEALSGMVIIQLFLRERDTYRRFGDLNAEYTRNTLYQIKIFGFFMPLIDVMNSAALALIIWYGGGEIIRRHMSLGVLVAFISYMRLFFQPLRELSQQYSVVQSAMASAERIFQLLEKKDFLPALGTPLSPEGIDWSIEFKEVTFGYDQERPVIRDLSLRVAPGETLAIVGATGAGKTTIINLLERFYDPDQGVVLLGSIDTRRLDPV